MERQTIIVIDHDEDIVEVSTNNRKWINRMTKLESEGHAEEVEASIEGNKEYEAETGLFRLPFHRTPRTWSKKQRKEAADRLAKVREKVAEQRAEEAEDEEEEETPKPKKKVTRRKKKAAPKPPPEPVEEEDDEELEEEELEDEDEPEEVVVKKPTRRRRKKKTS